MKSNAMIAEPPDLLSAIVAATRRIVEVRSASVSLAQIERSAGAVQPASGSFRAALSRTDRINVIAECKRRSPSRGVLRPVYDPVSIAQSYEMAGAAAISVLTEPAFFDGSLDHLAAVRRAVRLPILRKDFIVDRYQILEARAAGADAILLIAAALSPTELKTLHAFGTEAGLDVLVEVHALEEVAPALEGGARIIGVNSRNLRTLSVSDHAGEEFVQRLPDQVVAVAESGLKNGSDLLRRRAAGYRAFLIGERLMTSDDPGSALSDLLKDAYV